MPSPHPLLEVLTAGGARADRLCTVRELPARDATTAKWPAWAHPDLVAAYQKMGITRPWVHQVEAAEAIWRGQHVALATSTGSGKSLGFWLPALTAAASKDKAMPPRRSTLPSAATQPTKGAARGTLSHPADASLASATPEQARFGSRPASLYLSPTKALAADQLAGLERLLAAVPDDRGRQWRIDTCDGDTPFDERRWAQDHADVVLTNPDFLHFALLPNHRRWARFLKSLRFVVVDEGHSYRGVFGAHVSLVLRRLVRLAEHYGDGQLTFVVASATSADPAISAARLVRITPGDVVTITEDHSPAGPRTFALWRPPEIEKFDSRDANEPHPDPWALPDPLDPEVGHTEAPVVTKLGGGDHPRRTATAEAADLLADLATAGARTLAFTRSRRAAESIATAARTHLQFVSSDLAEKIAAYRGGYLPEERRALEQAIRTGDLLGLATTNALELGVDISGLDAVLIAGWPGTLMSVWQQAGRAGRAGAAGLVAFIAREDPLDTYLVTHPETVFDAPLEATCFDPSNPYVLGPQLCVAAQELPLREADLARFGDPVEVRALLNELVADGALRARPSGWYWTHTGAAAGLVDLRGTGGAPVRVVEATTGRLLGTVDAGSADGQVHAGAVYVHQGASFVVADLDLADKVALVHRREVDHGTWSREQTAIAIKETRRERQWGPITWGLSVVDVSSQVISFERRRLPDLAVLGTEPLELPERTLTTVAAWWSVPEEVLESARLTPDVVPGALHAAEHAAIGLLPLLATCDRWDLGGVSTALHPDTGCATVFVYDAYPGGAGFAERGFDLGAVWLRATLDAIEACTCEHGCPGCVQSPKCGTYNSPLNKHAAITLLTAVLSSQGPVPCGAANIR